MEQSWQEAISERTSKRSYEARDFPKDLHDKISGIIGSDYSNPFNTKILFELIEKHSEDNRKLKLGTYGFISGARYFIAGQVKPGLKEYMDYGYSLEKIILELTKLKLGTCWLGGTFDRGEFARAIELKEGYVIPAISPVGFPTESRSLGDRLIRLGAGSKNRKPWENLFFDGKPETPFKPEDEETSVRTVLEMVRLAPSASNLQPWRFVKKADDFHIYLQRKPGYQNKFSKVDLQVVDIGISLCHIDLTALELGIKPVWSFAANYESIDGWEYMVSVRLQK